MPQYFTGKKAAGYVLITDPDIKGGRVEKETRQCAHCGYQWVYEAGSKRKYGICLMCNGMTCSKMECNTKCEPLEKRMEDYEAGKRLTL